MSGGRSQLRRRLFWSQGSGNLSKSLSRAYWLSPNASITSFRYLQADLWRPAVGCRAGNGGLVCPWVNQSGPQTMPGIAAPAQRLARQVRGRSITQTLLHQEAGALLDFVIDARNVLSQDAQTHELDSAQEHHARHDRGIAGDLDAPEKILQSDCRGESKSPQRQQHAQSAQRSQGFAGEGQHACDAQRNCAAPAKPGGALQARLWLVFNGRAFKANPGVQAFHQAVAFCQAVEGVHHGSPHESEVPRVGRNFHPAARVDQLVEAAGEQRVSSACSLLWLLRVVRTA